MIRKKLILAGIVCLAVYCFCQVAATNNGTITMPTPNGSWGTITYGLIYLDTTKAFYGTVPNQIPDNGDTVEWLNQQFSVSIQ